MWLRLAEYPGKNHHSSPATKSLTVEAMPRGLLQDRLGWGMRIQNMLMHRSCSILKSQDCCWACLTVEPSLSLHAPVESVESFTFAIFAGSVRLL